MRTETQIKNWRIEIARDAVWGLNVDEAREVFARAIEQMERDVLRAVAEEPRDADAGSSARA